jgi:GrpB protein
MSFTADEYGADLVSDEKLSKSRIGELQPHNAPITLAEYDPDWPRLFAREADRIRAVLGETAVQVEHVGSTSVPGLAAKPIIDILLAAPDSADEPSYVPAMEKAGYVLRIREPDWFEHRLFKGPDTNINVHVFSTGAAEIDGCFPRRPVRAAVLIALAVTGPRVRATRGECPVGHPRRAPVVQRAGAPGAHRLSRSASRWWRACPR